MQSNTKDLLFFKNTKQIKQNKIQKYKHYYILTVTSFWRNTAEWSNANTIIGTNATIKESVKENNKSMYLKVPQQTHTKIDLFWFDLIETFIYCFISVTQIWYLQVLTLHNIALLQKKHKKKTGKRAKMEYQWKKGCCLRYSVEI